MVLHPKLPEHIVEKWQALNNENFVFHNTTDLVPLYKQADIMFADTTSAIQEFLLQEKPVVAFNHTFEHNYLIHTHQASELESAFHVALNPSKELIKNIQFFIKDLHPYSDGKSSARVIDATISFLHADKRYLKRKPLNLIRKYKIRKLLNYFTFKSYNSPYTIPTQHD